VDSVTEDCVNAQVEQEVVVNLKYDIQDNVVSINGIWYKNSNFSETDWQYFQPYGFRWLDGFFYMKYDTDNYELVSAELVNFPYEYYLSIDGDGSYYFESQHFDEYYRNQGEITYVKLTLKRK
jgi:hypothetical protein